LGIFDHADNSIYAPYLMMNWSVVVAFNSTPDVKEALERWWSFVPKTWQWTVNHYVYNVIHELLCEVVD
jgi:hypothetical protein